MQNFKSYSRSLGFLEFAYLLNMVHEIATVYVFHYKKESILEEKKT